MTKVLQEALEEVERLPQSDQENIGRQVLHHVEKLRLLRDDIDEGLRSLDAGKGREVDMRDVVSRAHARHEKGR
jgi:Flp pilus assembly CpaE family ATPase